MQSSDYYFDCSFDLDSKAYNEWTSFYLAFDDSTFNTANNALYGLYTTASSFYINTIDLTLVGNTYTFVQWLEF